MNYADSLCQTYSNSNIYLLFEMNNYYVIPLGCTDGIDCGGLHAL